MFNNEVYFFKISDCKIGYVFGNYQIKDKADLEKVKHFFEERGAKVKYDPNNQNVLRIEPSLYLLATSKPYTIYEDDIGDEVWVEFWGKKCNSGIFAYNGQVLYVIQELEDYLTPKQEASLKYYEEQSCSVPKCFIS